MAFTDSDIGPLPSPDDELTGDAVLHILLLPGDQVWAPVAEQGSAD
jgi:hypothetical protein